MANCSRNKEKPFLLQANSWDPSSAGLGSRRVLATRGCVSARNRAFRKQPFAGGAQGEAECPCTGATGQLVQKGVPRVRASHRLRHAWREPRQGRGGAGTRGRGRWDAGTWVLGHGGAGTWVPGHRDTGAATRGCRVPAAEVRCTAALVPAPLPGQGAPQRGAGCK